MEEPSVILSEGTSVVTHEQLGTQSLGSFGDMNALAQRVAGKRGVIIGVASSGDVYLVRHEGAPYHAAYGWWEFELTEADKSRQKDEAQAKLRVAETHFRFGIYRHKKGGLYVAYDVVLDEANLDVRVSYANLKKGTRWSRTLGNFTALLEKEARFTFVEPTQTLWRDLFHRWLGGVQERAKRLGGDAEPPADPPPDAAPDSNPMHAFGHGRGD